MAEKPHLTTLQWIILPLTLLGWCVLHPFSKGERLETVGALALIAVLGLICFLTR